MGSSARRHLPAGRRAAPRGVWAQGLLGRGEVVGPRTAAPAAAGPSWPGRCRWARSCRSRPSSARSAARVRRRRRSRPARGSANRARISSARPTASSSQRSSNRGFVERHQGVGQAGVVVEIGVAAWPGRRASSAAAGRRRGADASRRKSAAAAAAAEVARLAQRRAGPGQGVDHQAVPADQHLVVAARAGTRRSRAASSLRAARRPARPPTRPASRPSICAHCSIGFGRLRMLRPSKLPASRHVVHAAERLGRARRPARPRSRRASRR